MEEKTNKAKLEIFKLLPFRKSAEILPSMEIQ